MARNGAQRKIREIKGKAREAVARAARGAERGAAALENLAKGTSINSEQMLTLRDLFWNNVVRDMLNGLSMLLEAQPELFDGRFGVLTRQGERIPIAHVYPLFACSVPGTQTERDMSAAVQCTVFRITTPEGEVFTLPVQEIRAIHTMTAELIEKLQALSEKEAEGDEEGEEPKPFGLAAFTALPKPPVIAAPEGPTE
ncbi:MAG TPA: hypothetical protein VHC70_13030 [Phycisphaerales bacterium]|jgi:hypothetical protein|nr:hypothetical protein [Phycisphaerales bacterium]